MKIISSIVSIVSIVSCISISTSNKPNFCINCIHFRGNFFGNKFGKCSLFPVTEYSDNKDYLVNGIKPVPVVDYKYCSIVRSYHECGKERKMYKEKKQWWFLSNKDLQE